jgi:hypothetical protein
MRRLLPYLLLMLALVFQNASFISAAAMVDASPAEHCAGHLSPDESCVCCPDGAMASAGCATQCASAQQAPASIPFSVRHDNPSQEIEFVQRLIRNPAYTPLIPPPIA